MHSMEIVCSELTIEDRLAVANVNEGDRLAFITHLVSKLCYLVRLVSRVRVSMSCILNQHYVFE